MKSRGVILKTVLVGCALSSCVVHASDECSPAKLNSMIGHGISNVANCVDIDSAKVQFGKDFLPIKQKSEELYNRYSKQSSLVGISPKEAAPVLVSAVNEQVGAMYNISSSSRDFKKIVERMDSYYVEDKCAGKVSKTGLTVSCPESNIVPSFKDTYHLAKGGKYTFDHVSLGQTEMLEKALFSFDAKLGGLYSEKKAGKK